MELDYGLLLWLWIILMPTLAVVLSGFVDTSRRTDAHTPGYPVDPADHDRPGTVRQ